MAALKVALSTVQDGSMYIPSDQENKEIINNRISWLEKQGIALSDTTRLHISYDQESFCRYRIVNGAHKSEGMENGEGEHADALVTTKVGHALFLPIADCVATTIYDEEHGVLMLSHLGRHSLEQNGGVRSVEFLTEKFNTDPARVKVYLSPAPGKEAYPIFKLGNKGMKEAVFEQLLGAGVIIENIFDNPADTVTDDNYFSYSEFLKGKKPVEGRFAMVAMMTPSVV